MGQPVSFDPGQAIVEHGDAGDGMFIIVSGTAKVDVGGRFHKLTTGNFFGEMALVSAGKRMATVKAVEPVEALKIPRTGSRRSCRPTPRSPCRCCERWWSASAKSSSVSTRGWRAKTGSEATLTPGRTSGSVPRPSGDALWQE